MHWTLPVRETLNWGLQWGKELAGRECEIQEKKPLYHSLGAYSAVLESALKEGMRGRRTLLSLITLWGHSIASLSPSCVKMQGVDQIRAPLDGPILAHGFWFFSGHILTTAHFQGWSLSSCQFPLCRTSGERKGEKRSQCWYCPEANMRITVAMSTFILNYSPATFFIPFFTKS